MSQKDKRPPVGVGAGNAAFGKAAFSGAHYTTVRTARTEADPAGGGMKALPLPDVARGMLKALIVALANNGLITSTDAEHLIRLLELGDA